MIQKTTYYRIKNSIEETTKRGGECRSWKRPTSPPRGTHSDVD